MDVEALPQGGVAVFVRYPEKGRVKTRLARDIGDARAVELYSRFVQDTLARLRETGRLVVICHDPPDALADFKAWLRGSYLWLPQRGADLGARMSQAFADLFGMGIPSVLLMGSDIPHLPMESIREGFEALETRDAVIGPSVDGGYYLIGFKAESFQPAVFQGIPWSTGAVLTATHEILNRLGLRLHLLKRLRDVDDLEDLRSLDAHPDLLSVAPRTHTFLAASGLMGASWAQNPL